MKRYRKDLFACVLILLIGLSLSACEQTVSLSVVETDPESNATSVPVNGKIAVTFNTSVNSGTVDHSSFYVVDGTGVSVAGTLSCSGSQASFIPDQVLDYDKPYTAVITTQIESTGGSTLEEDYSWGFNTEIYRDKYPPVPGDSGILTVLSLSAISAQVNWSAAVDDTTSEQGLLYRVFISQQNLIDTIAEMEANGTPVNEFTPSMTEFTVNGLEPETTYAINVMTQDEAGNKAAYESAQISTPVDIEPPSDVAGISIAVTQSSLTLNWIDSKETDLKYILISWGADETIIQPGTQTAAITDLMPETAYDVLIKVTDIRGNSSEGRRIGVATTASAEPVYLYYIFTAEDLIAVGGDKEAYIGWDADNHYELMTDITLDAYQEGEGWKPIVFFDGVLKGNNHCIENLTIKQSETGSELNLAGLFETIGKNAIVRDLNFVDVSIETTIYAGALAAYNMGSVKHCAVTGNSFIQGNYAGGLIGSGIQDVIEDCTSSATVQGIYYTGGIVGYDSDWSHDWYHSSIKNCSASGTISGGGKVGGVIGSYQGGGNYPGHDQLVMEGCHFTGTVQGVEAAGGMAGSLSNAIVTNCYALGNVEGNGAVGGLAGGAGTVDMTDCYADVEVRGGNGNAGGLVGGYSDGVAKRCFALGTTSGNGNSGGLFGFHIGYSDDPIRLCYATGDVSGMTAGGLVGNKEGSYIQESFATGNVFGVLYAGGLVGVEKEGSIHNCYARGDVVQSGNDSGRAGGLIASWKANNYREIKYSYSTGSVIGSGGSNSYVAGFIADVYTQIKIFHCLYFQEPQNSYGTFVTADQMKIESTYTDPDGNPETADGWDFIDETANGASDIWGMDGTVNDGFPYLAHVD